MGFIVCSYFTKDEVYSKCARNFVESLKKFSISHDVVCIDSLGSWLKNVNYKPTFALKMLKKHYPLSIIVVDVDARFMDYPILFDTLDCNIAVHEFDRSNWPRGKGKEILSGTIFLKNNERVFDLVEKWEEQCNKNPRVWDQKSLEKILSGNFYNLPGEYCKIFGLMNEIKDPIIIHYQASRGVRKNKGKLT